MSLEPLSIALIEDDPIMGESLNQCLELEGFRVEWWKTGRQALSGLDRVTPDLVICDIKLPDISGEDLFRTVSSDPYAPPFLFMTAFSQIDQAVSLMRSGAGDYVSKPFEFDDLLGRVRALVARRPIRSESALGHSPQMRHLDGVISKLANRNTPVLFTGETGVGKEVCVRHLHTLSVGADEPFIAVNCAAIPETLLESEVFGHERGAFTGASERHIGYAERARRGTLFLDEVGEMPFHLQAKLLRLLDERRIYRLGGQTAIAFDARIVCATHRDLSADVRAGRFREDLLYRINVVTLHVPPLRDRPEDVRMLLQRFFDGIASVANPALRGISLAAEQAALAHHWPGNVRELRNRVERAVALTAGEWLTPADLFPDPEMAPSRSMSDLSLAAARDAAERREIERALQQTNGQVGGAAKLLGISRTTLWARMRRLSITTPQ